MLLFKADDARSNKLVEAMIKQNEQTCLQDLQEFPVRQIRQKASSEPIRMAKSVQILQKSKPISALNLPFLDQSEWPNRPKSCKMG